MSRIIRGLAIILMIFSINSCKRSELPIKEQYTAVDILNSNLPDFSYVGYRGLSAPLPSVQTVIELNPVEGDNYQQIQEAINKVSAMPLENGIRGAIFLHKGLYEISSTLQINSSGITIRGAGQGPNGTEIKSMISYSIPKQVKELQSEAVINIRGIGGGLEETGSRVEITKNIKNINIREIEVSNGGMFNIGDTVSITRTPNTDWINFLGMSLYGWEPDYYKVHHPRIIEKIVGNKLTVNVPLFDTYIKEYGGGYVSKIKYDGRIANCGVENLRISSVYKDDEDENHIWSAVILENVANCWVRNLTGLNLSFSAVAILNSNNNTVQDCAIKEYKSKPWGDRRYPFYISTGSIGNLVQRCYADGARHDFATGSRVPGPNVFLDCLGVNSLSDTGPHHRWATGTLYDNISSGNIYVRNAKDGGSGHGWTGAYNMFWNNHANRGFLIQNPPGAVNWVVGGIGNLYTKSDGYNASHGIHVKPRSLFLEQVKNRLGEETIRYITVPKQRGEEPIWKELKEWNGDNNPLHQ